MNPYIRIDEQIQKGYDYQKAKNPTKCCDIWLEAWDRLKELMTEDLLDDIRGLDKIYEWTQFISNYVQDLENELRIAGESEKTYHKKRITYCQELYERLDHDDQLTRENTRRAMAESYFIIGEHERAEQEFEAMIREDPAAGFVYMGWADCYAWELEEPRFDKANEILHQALSQPNLRERNVILERIIEISEKTGDEEKAKPYSRQLRQMYSVIVNKVGRNEPCPCGSGKKYKKCCGW